jgi:hypothetical protein
MQPQHRLSRTRSPMFTTATLAQMAKDVPLVKKSPAAPESQESTPTTRHVMHVSEVQLHAPQLWSTPRPSQMPEEPHARF